MRMTQVCHAQGTPVSHMEASAMKKENNRYSLFGNTTTKREARKIDAWQKGLAKKFSYDPDETYALSLEDNPYLWAEFGLKDIVRSDQGKPLNIKKSVVCGTIRMGFGHYRIAMAGASCARAMGFTPLWLDYLSIPGITTDMIADFEKTYSMFSKLSQKSRFFNKYLWEPLTTGENATSMVSFIFNSMILTWPWKYLKSSLKEVKTSQMFASLFQALPSDVPVLTSHFYNTMGAVAGGMNNVVSMVFDNWPLAFQLVEGAQHGIQSPSAYYGFRTLKGFNKKNAVMKPADSDAVHFVGHHVDHEIVENIEADCSLRLKRMKNDEPRRLLLTMGGAGAQRELFQSVVEHCLPLIRENKMTLFVNLGDHKGNWEWLQKQLKGNEDILHTHLSWDDTKDFTDGIRKKPVEGLHVFLHDNVFHAVYSTNYLMRVVDVLITKPSELSFYPVPKIFNERVGGHEMWGAIRGAEVGDGTPEMRTIPHLLQAIDLMVDENDLLEMYCSSIVKNKSIGLYDGAYKCVELATGKKWNRKVQKK